MYLGNVMLLALNLPLIGLWVRLLQVPYNFLAVGVLIFCIIGAYSVNNSAFDVGSVVAFGAAGYLLRKGGFPAAPLVLAMILGPHLERTLQQSLIGSDLRFSSRADCGDAPRRGRGTAPQSGHPLALASRYAMAGGQDDGW
jgi:putative tricarboxylic transport membrane protein